MDFIGLDLASVRSMDHVSLWTWPLSLCLMIGAGFMRHRVFSRRDNVPAGMPQIFLCASRSRAPVRISLGQRTSSAHGVSYRARRGDWNCFDRYRLAGRLDVLHLAS
jgi:hypothetical protein